MNGIKCKVYKSQSIFASERIAEFKIEDTVYSLIVDERDVNPESAQKADENGVDGFLRIRLLEEVNDNYLVDLPRDSSKGRRIFVPKELIA
ncbi:MAG: hypothetical protein IEMM0008_0704 [bacterium]|nr:MAG: hypothetical protein IEMM0008_0704 [bacterium]